MSEYPFLQLIREILTQIPRSESEVCKNTSSLSAEGVEQNFLTEGGRILQLKKVGI